MKTLAIFLLSMYQVIISPFFHHFSVGGCRYLVSCSEYAKNVITTHGVLKGGMLALKRVSTCHPFAKVAPYQV